MADIQTGRKPFIQLTDVPPSYATFGTDIVRVNVAETALEFIAPGAIGGIDHSTLINRNLPGQHRSEAVGVLSPYSIDGLDIGRRWIDLGDITIVGISITSSVYLGSGISFVGLNNGTIHSSKDHGYTWAQLTAPSAFRVNSMAYVGDGILITGDTNGQIFQSVIYGQESPFPIVASVGVLRAMVVAYFGDGICIAGDSNGNIYRSTNFGGFWAPIAGNPQTANSITSITYIENDIGIFTDGLGASGKIFRTTNSGLAWSQVLSTSSPFLSSVYIGDGVVLAGQSNGRLWRSTDYGANWTDEGIVTGIGAGSVRTLTYLGNGIVMITTSGADPGHVFLSQNLGLAPWTDLGDITGAGRALATASYLENGVVIIGDNGGHVFRSDVAFKTDEAVHDIPDRIVTFPAGIWAVNFNHVTDIANAAAGAVTFLLPFALDARGRPFEFKKIDATANLVTLTPQAGDSIDGNPVGYVLAVQYQAVRIKPDGTTNWWIV